MSNEENTIMPSQVPPRKKPHGKSPVFTRLEKFLPAIKARYGVKRIGIFGSYARGDETVTSDVDILVEFAPGQATFDNFMQLAYDLEDLFEKKVDLLTVAGIDKYIRSQVEDEVIWIEG
ncbi:MAG: nucleotidyltransferase family protein [Methanolinea sp.]|nr:nucleotidyltransferase family protein [Methanolinea sp.]